MNFVEFGTQNKDIMILLHGGGLSCWNYREVAEKLQDEYHIILPILDGHADSDTKFTTIENNATELISFIDEHLQGAVFSIGGLSLGAQIVVEMLSQRKNICQYAFLESALVIPMNVTYKMVKPAIHLSYGLIKKAWFSKLQFKSLHLKENLYDEYYRDTCKITKENMIAFLYANSNYKMKTSLNETQAKVKILVGGKEDKNILHSAYRIQTMIKESDITVFNHYYHGELSINHADEYVSMFKEWVLLKQ